MSINANFGVQLSRSCSAKQTPCCSIRPFQPFKQSQVAQILQSKSRKLFPRPQIQTFTSTASSSPDAASTTAAPLALAADLKKHKWMWNGYEIAYVTQGCGDPIVLIHGFGASAGHYRRLIPELAKTHKVYAIDLLGFGGSEKPLLDYTMEIWDQQIRDFLAEFVQQPAVIVGNSVGSLATLMVGAAAPQSVQGIVLLNCAGGMNNKAISDDWRIKLAMPIFSLIDWLLNQPKIARKFFDNVREKETLRKILIGIYPGNPGAVDDDLVDMLYDPSCDANALEVFCSVITGPPGPRPEDLIPKINAPMLILWGTKDGFTPSDGPVGRYFQKLPETKERTQFVHLEGVGHAPMDEAPEMCLEKMVPWLESARP